MQGTAQGGQQFGLVFRAEGAVQQLRQGFLLQAAPAVGLAAGQDRHKGDAIRGGRGMSEKELEQHGINRSATHVDFMLGTPDLSITGIKADGTQVPVFQNGNWAF